MKKLFTLWVLVATFSLGVVAQKKVGYFISAFRTYEVTSVEDPVLTLLKADPNFTVTVIADNVSDAVFVDVTGFDNYDIIILPEAINSTATALKPAGNLAISKLNKPTLYNKSFTLIGGRALPGANTIGAGVNQSSQLNMKVDAANQSNPLFKAINFDANGEFKVLNATANDLGATGTNGLSYVKDGTTPLSLTPANAPLAVPAGTLASTLVIGYNDIPANTVIGNGANTITTQARIITLFMNYGSMIASSNNLTVDGLTLWRNSIYSLAGLEIPSTPATLPASLPRIKAETGSVLAIAGGIKVSTNAPSKVSVYSIDGKVIASKTISGTETIACQKGIYMVRINGSAVKVMVAK